MDKQIRLKNYCLNLYKFYLEYYNFKMIKVIPMVTTQKIIAIEYMQKKMRNDLYITLQKKIN